MAAFAFVSMGVGPCSDGPFAPITFTGSPNPVPWTTNPTTVTFTSTGGSGSIDMGKSATSGPGAANFSITGDTCNGTTVPYGGSCAVTVSRSKTGTTAYLDVKSKKGSVVGSVRLE